MNIKPVTEEMIPFITQLAGECFIDDPFYLEIDTNREERIEKIKQIFALSIRICMQYGYAYYYEQDAKAIAFALWFNYNKLKKEDIAAYQHIFPANPSNPIHYKIQEEQNSIEKIIPINTEYLYLLAIGVKNSMRKQGIATRLIEIIQKTYPQFNLFADLSNRQSVKLYLNLGFTLIGEGSDCIFTHFKSSQPKYTFSKGDEIYLALPIDFPIASFLDRKVPEKIIQLPYISTQEDGLCFKQSLYGKSEAKLICIKYDELLRYQRFINVAKFLELKRNIKEKTVLVYTSIVPQSTNLKITDETNQLFTVKREEWDLTPDIYISIPIRYTNIQSLIAKHNKYDDANINQILHSLDFRTKYEAGIPIQRLENRNFKDRISRYYLGTIEVQLQAEEEVLFCGDNNSKIKNIGSSVEMGMIISIDQITQTGVLHIVSLSCGLLTTQLLDSISRNQINIWNNDKYTNLYQYLKQEFGLEKKGSPKSFITVGQDRNEINDRLLASILFCETFYEAGESLGTVADTEIIKRLSSEHGLAQYNYASVYAYTNVVIQISENLAGSITERIVKESITLFYIELILFEEAAIHIVNDKIIAFLTQLDKYSPDTVLKNINNIISSHMRTIEFWDIQMNYPSSKKSIDDIRRAFKIRKEQELIERNKTQLLAIYQIRSSIIDRTEAAILSAAGIILTVISLVDIITDGSKSPVLAIVALLVGILLLIKRYLFQKVINCKES